jgi:putative ABC transport system permease protein
MTSLFQDLKYALRSLRKSPGFTAVAVLTLALGIGANTAVFTVVNSVLLTPLPYPHPEQLVVLWEAKDPARQATNVVNPDNYLDWRERARSFTGLAAMSWTELTFTGDAPEVIPGRGVTPNFFDVLGVAPARGRTFTAEEARPDGPRVLVISDGLWRRRFGADPAIVGKAVPVAGGAAVVLGVMPPSVRPMPWGNEEYWEPFRLDPGNRTRHGRYLMVVGRLRSGVTRDQARLEMAGIARTLERQYPDFDSGWGVNVVGLTDQVVGSARTILLVLLGAVSLLLLTACANVANLLVSRTLGRTRELAIRAALGASRWRLIRQRLLESVLLGLAGGAAAWILAKWAVALLLAARPVDVPRLAEIGLNLRVLGLTAVVSLAAGVAFGLIGPSGDRSQASTALRSSAGRLTCGRTSLRIRAGLVVAQVSLALMLVAGAGLLVRSLQKLTAIDPGFDPASLLTVTLDLPSAYKEPARQTDFFDQLLGRIRGMPGVEAAGAVTFLPLTGQGAATSFTVAGRPAPAPGEEPVAEIRIVDPGYFRAMRIPILRGRAPGAADGPDSPPVILVNATLARKFWPGEDPIGRRVKVGWTHPDVEEQVIGVVGNVRGASLDAPIRPRIYYPRAQEPTGYLHLVVRHTGDPGRLAAAIRGAVRNLDRNVPILDAMTMYARLASSMADRRYPMFLLGGFAVLAVALSAIGLYGVLAYAVSQRVQEIGLRVALGARPSDILGLVVGQGMRVVGIGVGLGLCGALLATRALRSLLYGVTPTDPATLVAAGVGLAVVALIATALPARRATKIDPMEALRAE